MHGFMDGRRARLPSKMRGRVGGPNSVPCSIICAQWRWRVLLGPHRVVGFLRFHSWGPGPERR